MESVLDFIDKELTPEQLNQSEVELKITLAAYHSLQFSITNEVKRIMNEKSLRFTDLRKKLDTSDRMASKLLKGGSLNFETISKISLLNGKIPRIVWE